jgi:ribosome-binding ATPase YchF (GTP1/OBG family)
VNPQKYAPRTAILARLFSVQTACFPYSIVGKGPTEASKMRLEGKDYVVKDGDVMLFRFAT